MDTTAPRCRPHRLAAETWLVPRLVPAGEAGFVPVNSMVITGEQPVIVDTGAVIHAKEWAEDVFGLVEPADVRWIFLSHEDADHMGSLRTAMDLCVNATLVTDFMAWQRISVHTELPLHRMRWLNPGERLDIGDRELHAVLPPQFDSPTTRGVVDSATGVMWAADAFAAPTPGEIHELGDLPAGLWDQVFMPFNSMGNPWHSWLDPDAYGRHLDTLEKLPVRVAASCHGPVLRGAGISDAYAKARAMAGAPAVPAPGQPVLDDILKAAGLIDPTG
ncbi:hypothetical protein GCM10020367_55400 [Streptomyces sannanensis]|uniref:Metallo-beta-lactamase domain-containing protein n=1 Tax=Streptomyces sannanensis TaxID=285536 RepID=A0ABP6SJ14_9ACTN